MLFYLEQNTPLRHESVAGPEPCVNMAGVARARPFPSSKRSVQFAGRVDVN